MAWQPQVADAVAAGRDRKRRAVAGRFLDGALQGTALVVGTARPQPELGGIDAERADRRGRSTCGVSKRRLPLRCRERESDDE